MELVIANELDAFSLGKLRQDVVDGKIHWRDAQSLICAYYGKKKPWQTKEWKQKRNELIADRCTQCGTQKLPMVLQHTWHSPDIFALKKKIRASLSVEWKEWNEKYPRSRAYDEELIGLTGKNPRQLLKEWYDAFDESHGVTRDAFVKWLDDHIRYMSCEDTITLCRRCAFVSDKTNMILCVICRSNYHSPKFERCFRCAEIKNEKESACS